MSSKNFSVLPFSMSSDNYEMYFSNPTESDSPSTLELNRCKPSCRGGMSQRGPRINPMLKGSLLEQVNKIKSVIDSGNFALPSLVAGERMHLNEYSNKSAHGHAGGGGWTQFAQRSELDAVDHLIEAEKEKTRIRYSLHPKADALTRIGAASIAATTVQVAGIITDGVFESIGEGFSTVCGLTPGSQRACNHLSERASSLALASAEFAKEHWEGSKAQSAYNSAAETLGSKWNRYVEISDHVLMEEGLTFSQIEKYNRDLATIGHGVGSLVIGGAAGGAGTLVVRNVKKSMNFLKAQVTNNVLPKAVPAIKNAVVTFNDNLVSSFRMPKQIKSPLELVKAPRGRRLLNPEQYSNMKKHRLKHAYMIAEEQRLLQSSMLAPGRIKSTKGLAKDVNTFYSKCYTHLIKGADLGPNCGRINHALMYQISGKDREHMFFYIKKQHYSLILRDREMKKVHNVYKLTAEEQLDFIIDKSYELAQKTPGITRVSFAWDSDFYPVASTLKKKGYIFEGRGSFALVKPNKHAEHFEVKLIKPE